jgi:hypothetical protein
MTKQMAPGVCSSFLSFLVPSKETIIDILDSGALPAVRLHPEGLSPVLLLFLARRFDVESGHSCLFILGLWYMDL